MREKLLKFCVRLHESLPGQTMTEYALILAAVAVAAFVAYQGMGSSISTMATKVGSDL
ncbi:MAG: Flp family type IVb pilin [Candidatus Binataceae bacterium]|nr:Flp family type IVb pilin [Candidatus Binataceae bacterium]